MEKCHNKDWLVEFFVSDDGASVSVYYNEVAGSGCAKSVNILQDTKFLKKAMKSFKVDTTDKAEEIEFVLGWVYIPQLTNKIKKSHLTTTLKHVIM